MEMHIAIATMDILAAFIRMVMQLNHNDKPNVEEVSVPALMKQRRYLHQTGRIFHSQTSADFPLFPSCLKF